MTQLFKTKQTTTYYRQGRRIHCDIEERGGLYALEDEGHEEAMILHYRPLVDEGVMEESDEIRISIRLIFVRD